MLALLILSKVESINYLFFFNSDFILSNNTINEFISFNYNFNDDEIVDYYISFLKSLSIRLETNPLQLFFNEVYLLINSQYLLNI